MSARRSSRPNSQGVATGLAVMSPSAPSLRLSQSQSSQDLPDASRDGVVLGTNEFTRLLTLASGQQQQTELSARKVRLREISKSRYQHWNNTLEASREKKKSMRQERIQKQERELADLDAEEERICSEQRKMAIDRANRLMYQENGRVKDFNSALLASHCIKEREAQLAIKKQREEMEKRLEEHYHKQTVLAAEKMNEREKREAELRKEKTTQQAEVQAQQLVAYQERRRQHKEEETRQGELNRRIAQEALSEQQQKEAEKRVKQKVFNQEYMRMNEEQKVIKESVKALEKQEESKIKEFAAQKERTLNLRRDTEAQRAAVKAAFNQKMLQRQFDHLQSIKDNEQQRIDRHVEEAQAKSDQKVQHDQKMRAEMQAAMLESRQAQMARLAHASQQKAQEEAFIVEQWKARAKEMETEDLALKAAARDRAKQIEEELAAVERDQKARAAREKEQELAFAKASQEAVKREEQIFQQYAATAVREFAAMGKPTHPLTLALTAAKAKAAQIQPARLNAVVKKAK